MDIDPIAIAIVGVIGLIALGVAVYGFRKRARLLSLPVLGVEHARGHDGDAVVVGRAAGEEITSPWTERTGVFFSATEVIEEHQPRTGGSSRSGSHSGSRSQRRRRHHHLGEAGLPLTLASDDGTASIAVHPDGGCDVAHLPKISTASTGGGASFNLNVGGLSVGGGNQRSWVEERAAFAGDQLYVAGTVADRGGEPTVTGKVAVAAKDPAAQGKSELVRAGVAAVVAVAALGFVVVALVA